MSKQRAVTFIIMLVIIMLGIVLLFCTDLAKPAVTIILNGQPQAVIVLPTKPSPAAAEGAEILAEHLRQISGAQLKVIKENELRNVRVSAGRIETSSGEPITENYILVGQSELAKKLGATSKELGPGGILMRTIGNALVLLGPDDATPADSAGSRYAVTTFLEDVLGCRYLWPGENGKVVPKTKTIAVNSLNVHWTPVLKQRNVRWSGYRTRMQKGLDRLGFTQEDFLNAREEAARTQSKSSDWMGWHRMGGSLGLKTGDGSILSVNTWDRFLREHPEWFAMQLDGSRFFDPRWERPRLCKSNPELIEAIVQEKLKELRENPDQKSVSLMTHDGGEKAGFCMCSACKALDPPDGPPVKMLTYDHEKDDYYRFDYVAMTDRMLYFYNAIADKVAQFYPHVLFTGQAYSYYRTPPLREKLHPNIVIRFVHPGNHYSNDLIHRRGMKEWDGWADAAKMIYWRPNCLLWGLSEGIPGVYVHKLAEDFRHIAHNKCIGTDFDSCIHHWATQGLNYYVVVKLHWDPDIDVDEVIDDYCHSGFEQAAQQIKQYFLRIEQLTDQTAAKAAEKGKSESPDETEVYTSEVITELRNLLDAAEKSVGDNMEVRQRIGFLRLGLDFTELQAKIYRFLRLSEQSPLSEAEQTEAKRLLDQKWLMMRKIFKQDHYAVNVAKMCAREWGRFERLGWSGPSPQVKDSVGTSE